MAYGTWNLMQNLQVKTVSLPTRPVVVAAGDLQLGAEMRGEDLRVVELAGKRDAHGGLREREESSGAA